eukprot:CAMPEP_0197278128 /NCGR_PEP_ID=MMETSP1432-20130617/18145_1 /TAXON_ID=44447 /ORGANISM="Pseudo-nitzschia delicatissima, Strain UNC1205" /LENGTH=308 /DNA_ID=CAMNT_0042744455 /DNA_START=47 /DNA_END=973 /DNA_ORIENTATION=-
MSSSSTSLYGNFSTIPQPTKSPKSPKGVVIENPLMKNAQFSFGSKNSALVQTMPRSPLMALTPNRDSIRQQDYKARTSQIATPGPPPKMSLSLMGGMAMPMQTKPAMAKEPERKAQDPMFISRKAPTAASTPVPVASPRLLQNKPATESYFRDATSNFSSESLVADHWVVAHGYTSLNEYKELLGILSSYGTIQNSESGGNWVAVLYESRLSAEKALCCQPVLLSNTLCGMTRGTPQLLQSLNSGEKPKPMFEEPTKTMDFEDRNLNERDILCLDNSAYQSRQAYKPKSVCDKVFAWYFGWEEHSHSD